MDQIEKNVGWGLGLSISFLTRWRLFTLNVSLKLIVRKGRVLSRLNYWRSSAYISRQYFFLESVHKIKL